MAENDRTHRRIDNARQDDDALTAQLGERNIMLRLTEIKGLLERQDRIYAQLSIAERIQLAEDLWDRIVDRQDEVELDPAQQQELDYLR
nr:addiction module protein [Chamaesiphon sp. OTE_75_metabat_556]